MGFAFPPRWLPFEENGLTYEGQVLFPPGTTAANVRRARRVSAGEWPPPDACRIPRRCREPASHLFLALLPRLFNASLFGFRDYPWPHFFVLPNSRPSLPLPEIVSR